MQRRRLMAAAAGVLLPLPPSLAQRVRQRRVVVIASEPWAPIDSLDAALRQSGFPATELQIDHVWFRGERSRLAALADEVVRDKPDIIVTVGTPPVVAIKERTSTIPVVMGLIGDPVGSGIIASLSQPGGNITGVSVLAAELEPKRIELLREMVPGFKRLAILANAGNAYGKTAIRHARGAADRLGLDVAISEISGPGDVSAVLERLLATSPHAVLAVADQVLLAERGRIAEVFLRAGLPSAFTYREHVAAGGLLAYATNYHESFRRAAGYVVRILAGRRPAELPVEQVERFELVVNGATAKRLGVMLSPSMLQRIDEMI